MTAADARRARVEARWRTRMRRRVALALAVALLLTVTTEPFRTWGYNATPLWLWHDMVAAYSLLLPTPNGLADLEPIAHVDVNPYGVNVFLEQEVEESKIRRSLEMIRAAGFGWIKQQLVWGEVEVPGKGSFVDAATGGSSWRKYDRIVDLANEYGLGVILRIDTSPTWARPGNPKLETPPDRLADYGDFVGAIAARYRGRVSHYQIWNEPNLPFEWGGKTPDPTAYTEMLRIASARIRAADPDAVVLSAALAPTTENSERGLNELLYLQAMYDAGARGSFDVLGANAYGLRSGPVDRRLAIDRDVNFSRPILVRQVMVRNGDAGRPIWAAEVGWNALPEEFPAISLFGRVSRETQAAYSVRAFERAQREWPWMGVLNLWHFRLVSPQATYLQQYYFNMVDDDFRPLPLYEAMAALAHRRPVVERGYRQESNWAIAYQGDWTAVRDRRAVLGAYRQSGAAGDLVRIPFRGTDLDLVIDRFPGGGTLAITIDGSGDLATMLPWTALGPRRLATDGSERWGERVAVARGLPDGRHELEARAVDNRPIRLDGVVVDRRIGFPGLTIDTLLLVIGLGGIGTIVAAGRPAAPRPSAAPARATATPATVPPEPPAAAHLSAAPTLQTTAHLSAMPESRSTAQPTTAPIQPAAAHPSAVEPRTATHPTAAPGPLAAAHPSAAPDQPSATPATVPPGPDATARPSAAPGPDAAARPGASS